MNIQDRSDKTNARKAIGNRLNVGNNGCKRRLGDNHNEEKL